MIVINNAKEKRVWLGCTPEETDHVASYTDMRSVAYGVGVDVPDGAEWAAWRGSVDAPVTATITTATSYLNMVGALDSAGNAVIWTYDAGPSTTHNGIGGQSAWNRMARLLPGASKIHVSNPVFTDPGSPVPGTLRVWFYKEVN